MYKSLDICTRLCIFASVNVTIDARASIFYLYSIGSIYNHEIPRSASHDLGIFIFPEFLLAVMVVCRLTPLGYADLKPKPQEEHGGTAGTEGRRRARR